LPDGSSLRPRLSDRAKLFRHPSTIPKKDRSPHWQGDSSAARFSAGLLREGVAAGELAEDTDIDAMAWYFLGVLQAV